jgi:hypothetical protein
MWWLTTFMLAAGRSDSRHRAELIEGTESHLGADDASTAAAATPPSPVSPDACPATEYPPPASATHGTSAPTRAHVAAEVFSPVRPRVRSAPQHPPQAPTARGFSRARLEGLGRRESPDPTPPLHRVRIVDVASNRIRVRDLEAIDGTPILDVKPILSERER